MTVWLAVLTSVAAAAVFFTIEPYLLEMSVIWRVVATLMIFGVSLGLAFKFHARGRRHRAISNGFFENNQVRKNLRARFEDSEIQKTRGSKKFSENKVGGNVRVDVKNSKL